jgi:hypothetical protein
VKLIWHIGPHKTGTTSLQRSLAAYAGSRRAAFFYPPTPEMGPGHAVLAWRLLGLNGVQKDDSVIDNELANAARAGFETVVISSEEFCRAAIKPDRYAPMARVAAQVECELVLTLRPLRLRLMPELQEMIKNGHRVNLTSSQEILDAVMSRPGLRPDFLSAAINEIKPSRVTVIMVDSEAPERLFKAMTLVVGDTLPTPKFGRENVSYPFIQTAWLDTLNRHAKLSPQLARQVADAAFTAAAKQAKELSAVPYPDLPPAIESYAEAVWHLQLAYLDALQRSGTVRLL